MYPDAVSEIGQFAAKQLVTPSNPTNSFTKSEGAFTRRLSPEYDFAARQEALSHASSLRMAGTPGVQTDASVVETAKAYLKFLVEGA